MITPEQCRSARAWLNWSQDDLAAKAKVALSTIRDFENGRRVPIENNVESIEAVFQSVGIVLTNKNGEPDGIRMDYRIKEKDTYIPVLEYLDKMPDGFLTTSDLISHLETRFHLSPEDQAILAGRSDTRFSQIVRNIVSHRDTPGNLIELGYVEYEKAKRGLRITSAGQQYLLHVQSGQKSAP